MRPPPGDHPNPTPPTPPHGHVSGKPAFPATGGLAPVTIRPKARAIEDAAERLPTLAHELANLLDGSMRSLNLVLRSREDHDTDTAKTQDADRRLRIVQTALQQMHLLIREAVGRSAWQRESVASPQSLTLDEAVRYAADLLDANAREGRITVSVECDQSLTNALAGPFFTVALNGLRNAIEAVSERARTAPQAPREITLSLKGAQTDSGPTVVLEIIDSGLGPPVAPPSRREFPGPFSVGFSTKPGGQGLGLALCREMISEAGGTLTLTRRADQTGAVLTASVPRSVVLP